MPCTLEEEAIAAGQEVAAIIKEEEAGDLSHEATVQIEAEQSRHATIVFAKDICNRTVD